MSITLQVHAYSGHYKVPGGVGQPIKLTEGGKPFFQRAPSFPVAPPSTVRGFLESLVGDAPGSFQGKFAYGFLQRPVAHGHILQKAHVWSSSGQKPVTKGISYRMETVRPILVEVWYDLIYAVRVEGPWEDRIRAALAGEVDRYGVLYLGNSDNIITWLDTYDGEDSSVEWVVPGTAIPLPVRTPTLRERNFKNMETVYDVFDIKTGEPHLHS